MNLLDCLGVGTVANNPELNAKEIFIYLPSSNPQQDGEIIASVEEVKVETGSMTGDVQSSTILEGNALPAEWMRLNSNRITPPNVRVGTKVVVYKYKNKPKYWWTLEGYDGTMRLETIIFAISASPNINENTPITPDNYYLFLISSHQKKIELLTGMGNGEQTSYQLTLDMGNGYFGLGDSHDGLFVINAVERSFTYTNQDMSTLSVNKEDITLFCKNNILLKANQSILAQTKNMRIECEDFSVGASNSIDMRTQGLTLQADSLNANIKNTNWTGDIKLNGTLHSTGKIKTDKDIEFGNTSGSSHTHSGVRGGDSNTGPVVGF